MSGEILYDLPDKYPVFTFFSFPRSVSKDRQKYVEYEYRSNDDSYKLKFRELVSGIEWNAVLELNKVEAKYHTFISQIK